MLSTRRSPIALLLLVSLLAAAAPASAAGNPDGNAPIPPEAQAVDTSKPDRVIGNEMTLRVEGTKIVHNRSNGEGGSAIFFVSNDRSGDVEIVDSVLRDNSGDGFSTHPGIFFLGHSITFTDSKVE